MLVSNRVPAKQTPARLGWLLVFLIVGCARQDASEHAAEPENAAEEKPSLVLLRTLEGHPGGIGHGALSEDGRRALTSEDRTVRLWAVDDGKEVLSRTFDYPVLAVTITPRQALAITGRYKLPEDQQNLRVWDVESGEILYCFPVPAHCAAFSPDGKRIVAGSGRVTIGSIHLSDPYLPVWDLESGRELGRYSGMPGQVGQVVFGWRDREVIATDYGPTINVWRVPGEKVDHRFSTNLGGGYDRIVFSRDGRFALTDCQHDLCLWDVDSGEKLNTYRSEDYARPRGSDISRYRIHNKGFLPDGQQALFGIAHEKLTEIKPMPQRERGRPFDRGHHVSLLDYTLVICNLKTGKELHRSAIQDYYLTYLAVSGNGRRALYARFNKLQVWELPMP